MKQLGQAAASYLLDQLNGKTPLRPVHQKLAAPLVIRASTAPPLGNSQVSGLGKSTKMPTGKPDGPKN
jgi:hypothetical protein